jgi:hypothetical protein
VKTPELSGVSKTKSWMLIAWPAFLAACLLQGLVFAVIDPAEVHWPGQTSQPTRQAIYTIAFFLFWLIAMACSSFVLWLARPEKTINDTLAG